MQEESGHDTQVKTRETRRKLLRNCIIPGALSSRVVALQRPTPHKQLKQLCYLEMLPLRKEKQWLWRSSMSSRTARLPVWLWGSAVLLGSFQNACFGHWLVSPPIWTPSAGLHCIASQQLVLSPQPERGTLNSFFLWRKIKKKKKVMAQANSCISHNRIKTL